MDGDILVPRTLQTDGIVGAAAKRERRSGNPRRFEAQIQKGQKSSDEPKRKARPDEPADAEEAQKQPGSSAPPAAADPAKLLDFEA